MQYYIYTPWKWDFVPAQEDQKYIDEKYLRFKKKFILQKYDSK